MYGLRKSLAHECVMKTTRNLKNPQFGTLIDGRTLGRSLARFNGLRQMHVSNQSPRDTTHSQWSWAVFQRTTKWWCGQFENFRFETHVTFYTNVHVFNITPWTHNVEPSSNQIMGCSDKPRGGLWNSLCFWNIFHRYSPYMFIFV
jgi:hypothetical protein